MCASAWTAGHRGGGLGIWLPCAVCTTRGAGHDALLVDGWMAVHVCSCTSVCGLVLSGTGGRRTGKKGRGAGLCAGPRLLHLLHAWATCFLDEQQRQQQHAAPTCALPKHDASPEVAYGALGQRLVLPTGDQHLPHDVGWQTSGRGTRVMAGGRRAELLGQPTDVVGGVVGSMTA